VQVPVPAPEGVKTPPELMVPPVAVQVTPVLNAPVPITVAVHVEFCAVVMLVGFATTVMPVTVGATFVTLMEAEPIMLV